MKKTELVGKRFGKLTVIQDSGQRKGTRVLWLCRCDCGGEITALQHQLVGGTIQSCGCLPRPGARKTTDLIGRRFGLLTVSGDSGQRTKEGEIYWRCICDCGNEKLATRRQLESGNATSCGCVPKQYASKRQAEDLTGRQFGWLTVLHRAENAKNGKVCWRCKCRCGNEVVVRANALKSGHVQSCGCKRHDPPYNMHDLTGRRFGRLTVLYRADREDRVKNSYWHCRCDCGNELDVYTRSLLHGLCQSCGCWKKELGGKIQDHMHYQDDTCLEMLKRACEDTGRNKTGFRGLFQLPNGKYRASITFQGKHYDLGHYRSFDRAVQARLDAEETLHQGYIEAYAAYEKKADADPAWAERNPFYYDVQRSDGRFTVMTNGPGPAPEAVSAGQETAVV